MIRISVIIPTFNRARILPGVIEALAAQEFPPDELEVIVVDDGSSDGTREYLASLGGAVRAFTQDHGGASRARNLGAEHARGAVLAFTDDDCRPEPDWLRVIASSMERRRFAAALLGRTWSPLPAGTFVHSVFKDSEPVVTCNFAVAREAFFRVGGFDPHFVVYFEDEDLGLRLKKAGTPIVYEAAMRVEHPSRYMSFGGYLRQRSYFQYFCYMSQKHPDGNHWRRHRGVVRQIVKRAAWLGVPAAAALAWPPLFALLGAVLLLHVAVDARRALACRRELRALGLALRPADFWAMTLLNWAVPFLDAWRIAKGYLRDWGKTRAWVPPREKPEAGSQEPGDRTSSSS